MVAYWPGFVSKSTENGGVCLFFGTYPVCW
jgi:hypothetical protein